jgi:hypothetical protein
MTHKFRLGAFVMLRPSPDRPYGKFKIVQRLPKNEQLSYEYKIKAEGEPFERLAPESHLRAAR